MPIMCLFCTNRVDSEEHLWPAWVHERKDFGPLIRTQDGIKKTIPHPRITARAVCQICNNGWMSHKLEVPNIPLIGCMMQNLSITLDRSQQQNVGIWCTKMAFLNDWTRRGGRQKRFYTREEAKDFAADQTIPADTRIWIGHLEDSHLSIDGHDLQLLTVPDRAVVGLSSVVTIVVGHFVAQVVTDHLLPDYVSRNTGANPRPGPWEAKLIPIRPIEREWVPWPPRASFTNGGLEGFAHLLHRWRAGPKVKELL